MPDYATHLIVNFLGLSGIYLLYVQHPFMTPFQLGIFVFAFFIGTVYITPDMDMKSEASKRCGKLCIPYRKIFRHRGVSHHWLWGMVSRIVYVLVLIGLGVGTIYVLGYPVPTIKDIVVHQFELALLVVGLFVANLFHIVLDTIS